MCPVANSCKFFEDRNTARLPSSKTLKKIPFEIAPSQGFPPRILGSLPEELHFAKLSAHFLHFSQGSSIFTRDFGHGSQQILSLGPFGPARWWCAMASTSARRFWCWWCAYRRLGCRSPRGRARRWPMPSRSRRWRAWDAGTPRNGGVVSAFFSYYNYSVWDFSPHFCVGFLFFWVLYPVRSSSSVRLSHFLSHTTLSRTIFHIFHTQLCHTIFDTPIFDTQTLSHTIFDTQSSIITRTHNLWHTTLSHTIFDTYNHNLSDTTRHLLPSTFVLRGRRYTSGTGLDPVARLGPAGRGWRRGTLRGRRGTWRPPRSICVADVGLGDIHILFAWQAWHLWHWAGSGGALGSRWSPVTPRHFAWQAWHLATSALQLRGRSGTWWHPHSLYVAGVALISLGFHWAVFREPTYNF